MASMLENKKVLPRAAVIQDMSGFGKVSLTEAIPVMSAMGIEVCPLPTAVLSTHTYEFKDYTLLDLTEEMEKIIGHWDSLGLEFDAVYSGYMSSKRQIGITRAFMERQKEKGAIIVVDPVMGDNALLDVKMVYSERMTELIDGMRDMCSIADAIMPNLTEACLLLDCEYPKAPLTNDEIKDFLVRLSQLGSPVVAVTGVMDSGDTMCVAVYDKKNNTMCKIDCGYVARPFHGTGDIYTSVFTGALIEGKNAQEAANIAAGFVAEAIKYTIKHPNLPIRQGVLFEPVLRDGYFAQKEYINRIKPL